MLSHGDPRMRRSAAWGLMCIGPGIAVYLRQLIQAVFDQDVGVAVAATAALTKMPGREVLGFKSVLEAVLTEEPKRRRTAMQHLFVLLDDYQQRIAGWCLTMTHGKQVSGDVVKMIGDAIMLDQSRGFGLREWVLDASESKSSDTESRDSDGGP